MPSLMQLLERYAEALTPWATRTVSAMLLEVDQRDRDAWRSLGNAISEQMHRDLASAQVGVPMRTLLDEQVALIKSLPLEAAQRVHKLTLQGLENSVRYPEIAKEILRSGEVTESRAILIARTEVARTATTLTKVRAQAVGSTHYTWETSRDGAVRPGHRAMQGQVCEWDNPPAVQENGKTMHFHPGSIWNCRCWARPIIDLE